ncbi:MAG: tyrosine-type recombinase/integrase [Chloroflexi bacterium]|nr:tyrosine-type recombinase/integrase [Chloroflexota bacterium]
MRGHIVKRSGNSYSIVLSIGNDPVSGKRKRQWVSVKGTKKEAETRLSELLTQLDSGTFVKPGKATVAEYLEKWLADYAQPNLTPRSFERYESIVRVHLSPALGNVALVRLRPAHLQEQYTAKLNQGMSARSVRYHHVVLHKALQTALRWGLVGRNVADAVDPPRARRAEMHTWDEGEIARFLEAAEGTPYHTLFYAALFTGMRRSELLALRWSDIDFVFSQVSVSRSIHHLKDGSYVFTEPKSARSRRTIAMPPSLNLLLKRHRENQSLEKYTLGGTLRDNDLVFSHYDGKPLRPNTVSRAWAILAAATGLKVIRFHDARHSHASLLLKQGVHPKVVQERLGHATIAVTLDTYSHVAPGMQEAAAVGFDKLVAPKL